MVQSTRASADECYRFMADFRDWFNKQIIGNGEPWTPDLKRKWKKLYQTTIPVTPDWHEIEKKVAAELS